MGRPFRCFLVLYEGEFLSELILVFSETINAGENAEPSLEQSYFQLSNKKNPSSYTRTKLSIKDLCHIKVKSEGNVDA